LSNNEVSITDDDGHLSIDSKENLKEDYHEAINSCKHKAKNHLVMGHINKKPICALDSIGFKKGKAYERPANGGKKVKSTR